MGKLARQRFPSGYYVYVGSAFGSGGLRARVGRHLRTRKARRWHIDYIRARMRVTDTWYTLDTEKQECQWANILVSLGGQRPSKGFGASDCNCESHLFHFEQLPRLSAFRKKSTVKVQIL